VGDCVGRGVPLAYALAAEDRPSVNVATWHKALQRHPNLLAHYHAGKGRFLARATARLCKDLCNLRWLLARRHSDLFGGGDAEGGVTVTVGLPADVVERAREFARGELPQKSAKGARGKTK